MLSVGLTHSFPPFSLSPRHPQTSPFRLVCVAGLTVTSCVVVRGVDQVGYLMTQESLLTPLSLYSGGVTLKVSVPKWSEQAPEGRSSG